MEMEQRLIDLEKKMALMEKKLQYVEISEDLDGGCLLVKDKKGKNMVVIGSTPDGGFIDVLYSSGTEVAVSIYARETEGFVELHNNQSDKAR